MASTMQLNLNLNQADQGGQASSSLEEQTNLSSRSNFLADQRRVEYQASEHFYYQQAASQYELVGDQTNPQTGHSYHCNSSNFTNYQCVPVPPPSYTIDRAQNYPSSYEFNAYTSANQHSSYEENNGRDQTNR